MSIQKWMSWLKDRHYDKAPIKEAIIDIQIESASLTLANFDKVEVSPPRGYAERQKVTIGHIRGRLEGGILTATANQDELGYAFVGGEGKHHVQFRLNGFTFSRLAPYQTWEQLRSETKTLWGETSCSIETFRRHGTPDPKMFLRNRKGLQEMS